MFAAEEPPRRSSRSRRLRAADSAGAPPVVFDLPMTRDEAVQGAVQGIRRAWAAGGNFARMHALNTIHAQGPHPGPLSGAMTRSWWLSLPNTRSLQGKVP